MSVGLGGPFFPLPTHTINSGSHLGVDDFGFTFQLLKQELALWFSAGPEPGVSADGSSRRPSQSPRVETPLFLGS